jgi:hypothetical protein
MTSPSILSLATYFCVLSDYVQRVQGGIRQGTARKIPYAELAARRFVGRDIGAELRKRERGNCDEEYVSLFSSTLEAARGRTVAAGVDEGAYSLLN